MALVVFATFVPWMSFCGLTANLFTTKDTKSAKKGVRRAFSSRDRLCHGSAAGTGGRGSWNPFPQHQAEGGGDGMNGIGGISDFRLHEFRFLKCGEELHGSGLHFTDLKSCNRKS